MTRKSDLITGAVFATEGGEMTTNCEIQICRELGAAPAREVLNFVLQIHPFWISARPPVDALVLRIVGSLIFWWFLLETLWGCGRQSME